MSNSKIFFEWTGIGRISKIGFVIFILSIWVNFQNTSAFAEEGQPLNLLSCYQLALKQSEDIAINQEKIKEAEGIFMQSLSTILPKVSYEYSVKWQDVRPTSSTSDEITEGKFVFSQPLFSGFKEFAAIASSRHEKKQRELELNYAKLLLFRDVSDAFYFYLEYQQDMEVLEDIHKILTERLEELKKRESLGRSRTSELVSVEAKLLRQEAEMENISSQKDVAGQLLEFLTGTANVTLLDDAPIESEFSDINVYLEQSSQRYDVLAQKEAWQLAKKAITIARSGYFPSLSLDGNRYTHREGSSKDNDWDTTLSVDVPIFQGGQTRGDVYRAHAVSNQEDLRYVQLKRKAMQEVKNAYTLLLSNLRRQNALAKAMEADQRNYDLQQQDFQVNLVNNLEVLQALEDLQDSRRDYRTIQNEVKQLYWRFKTAVGEIPDVAI